MATVITHVDGIEVIATEPATGPHPHPDFEGQIVLYTGITRLLLADESERFACDECSKSFEAIRSTVAHMGSHSKKRNAEAAQPLAPMYPMETIKAVLRAVLANSGRGQYEKAAAHLNKTGVPRLNNEPWNSGNIEQLYRRYKDSVVVRTPRQSKPVQDPKPARTAQPVKTEKAGANRLTELLEKQDELLARLEGTMQDAQSQFEEIRTVAQEIFLFVDTMPDVDEETIEKARKYDTMRNMFN